MPLATISLRVPDELNAKMNEHSDINWSAIIRSHLEEELDQLKSRNIGHAVATSERRSSGINPGDVQSENTATIIREWRAKRHGAGSD